MVQLGSLLCLSILHVILYIEFYFGGFPLDHYHYNWKQNLVLIFVKVVILAIIQFQLRQYYHYVRKE